MIEYEVRAINKRSSDKSAWRKLGDVYRCDGKTFFNVMRNIDMYYISKSDVIFINNRKFHSQYINDII